MHDGTTAGHLVPPYGGWSASLQRSDRESSAFNDVTISKTGAPLYQCDNQRVASVSADTVSGLSVARAVELQRTEMLLTAIADWRRSTGAQRGIDRRYAMRLLAAERARREAGRAELHAAATRSRS